MIKPLYDKIAVRPDKSTDKTPSGLYLPDSSKKEQYRGVVVAVGHGHRLSDGTLAPLIVKIGDRVSYSKYAGTAQTVTVDPSVGPEEILLIDEASVWAILEAE